MKWRTLMSTPANGGSNGLNGSAMTPRAALCRTRYRSKKNFEAIHAWRASPRKTTRSKPLTPIPNAALEADVEAEVRQRLYEEERARWGGDFISEYTAWADVVELPRVRSILAGSDSDDRLTVESQRCEDRNTATSCTRWIFGSS